MTPSDFSEVAYARATERLGYVRFLPAVHADDRVHVEWFHFVVQAGHLDLLVNLSLTARGRDAPVGHVALLVRRRDDTSAQWDGDVQRVPRERITLGSGRIRLRVGEASVDFDGAFRVRASCRRRRLSVDLRLVPQSFACLAHNLSPDGGGFHWVVTPRLAASGVVRWNDREHAFEDAAAYHDHNWGALEDDELTWDWSCSVANDEANPWNAVLVRMLDRTRSRSMVQGLIVWESGHRRRSFRNDSLVVAREGLLRSGAALTVPRGLSLLAPGRATDVPERVRIAAAADGDHVSGVLTSSDVTRILVPRERDLGTTVIHEVTGRLTLTGEIAGREVRLDAPAFSEVVEWQR